MRVLLRALVVVTAGALASTTLLGCEASDDDDSPDNFDPSGTYQGPGSLVGDDGAQVVATGEEDQVRLSTTTVSIGVNCTLTLQSAADIASTTTAPTTTPCATSARCKRRSPDRAARSRARAPRPSPSSSTTASSPAGAAHRPTRWTCRSPAPAWGAARSPIGSPAPSDRVRRSALRNALHEQGLLRRPSRAPRRRSSRAGGRRRSRGRRRAPRAQGPGPRRGDRRAGSGERRGDAARQHLPRRVHDQAGRRGRGDVAGGGGEGPPRRPPRSLPAGARRSPGAARIRRGRSRTPCPRRARSPCAIC